jgi:hypothetical protein
VFIIGPNIQCFQLKEGIALFNSFTGNTHLIPLIYSELITTLINTPKSKEALLKLFLCPHKKANTEKENMNKQFKQFITEALKSAIIVETN